MKSIDCIACSCRGDIGFPKVKARWRTRTMRLWRFTSTNITFRFRCRNRKAAVGRRAGISSMPSNAGICTVGVGSTRAFGPPLPRASSCSCHCSTTTPRCTARSVHRGAAYADEPTAGEPRPLPPIDSLLEAGKVLALNFPVGMNPGLARILGVMLKLDFQRAVLQRIPQITAQPDAGLAGSAVRLRRVPRLCDRRRNGSDGRRAHVCAVATGEADADRGHAEHQLPPVRAAG